MSNKFPLKIEPYFLKMSYFAKMSKASNAVQDVSQGHKEIKDNRHKGDILGALIRKC